MSDKELIFIKKYKRKQRYIVIIRILLLLSFILIWQLLSSNNIINAFIFSSPSRVIKTLYIQFINNHLINHILTTLYEISIAFILGFIISFIIAILLYLSNNFYKIIDPFLNVLNSLPKISLGPMIIIWFGANIKSIIVMSLLTSVLVCIESLYVGFIKCGKNELSLFKSMKANKIQILKYLVVPNAFENLITSLKLNISLTLIGVIMGEFLVSKQGIGYLIIYGTQVFNIDLVYSGILILLLLSYFIYKPISYLENKIKKD